MVAETTHKSIEKEKQGYHTPVKQPDFIFKQFIEALTADNGKHRTLTYYADLFCYSPKYLSRIVKQISGKNALTLIHENAIEHIIPELRHSNKSIKEISVDFEFPNVSFFCTIRKKILRNDTYRISQQQSREKIAKQIYINPKATANPRCCFFIFIRYPFYNQTNTHPYSQKLKHQEKIAWTKTGILRLKT